MLEGFLQQTVRRVFLAQSFLPRFLFQYVSSYACFPVEAGAKVLSLYVPSKSFYLFFCEIHSNVTALLHKLLILFYLSGKTFFRFSPISVTSLSFFSPISLKRADLLATTGWLNRY